MNTTFINTLAIIVVAVALLCLIGRSYQRDMTVCELSHSHDVCFQALNR